MTRFDPADTIAAISTPPGEAGIGIVRLSGPSASAIARKLFRPHRPRQTWRSHRLYLGHIVDSQGEFIDEVLLTWMQAPQTYTREDVVEINCHSGYGVLSRLLSLVLEQGARLAQPGEFTLRAFLSGRLDLTQAEAVLEVIRARTAAALRVAEGHLQGSLGQGLVRLREALLDWLARVEAALDFPEEAEELAPATLDEGLAAQMARLSDLAATYDAGRLLREGLLTVIAGRPNAGKSSLLNRLLDQDRAMVTEIPGTTRDLIEETITLGGVLIRLSDTAGLRPARDRLEELGIQRTRDRLAQADLVLYLVDGSEPFSPEDREALKELTGRRGLAVLNKVDLPPAFDATELGKVTAFPLVRISARTGEGIAALKQAMVDLALGGGLKLNGEMVTQARHYQLLESCLSSLSRARALLASGVPAPAWELVALELQEAIRELGEITGQEVGDDILERIFGEFCLGK
ncbi:MAG: tRNA uridine-5-carboxymethylaminomethyl(34) synthesis GTPase MnmE [Deltaproteobacteria bacterium]|nr:tRNA uridine-5-carboxymethylaminomethyl(34) synthesis GTPase MnmE [Deltaproteobacteria bacterium]